MGIAKRLLARNGQALVLTVPLLGVSMSRNSGNMTAWETMLAGGGALLVLHGLLSLAVALAYVIRPDKPSESAKRDGA